MKAVEENTPCGYCFAEWATGFDHLVPQSYRRNNSESNLYPCCQRCNSILGSLVFDTLQEKRAYVRGWLRARGQWTPYLRRGRYGYGKRTKTRRVVRCPACHREFLQARANQLYCTTRCKNRARKGLWTTILVRRDYAAAVKAYRDRLESLNVKGKLA